MTWLTAGLTSVCVAYVVFTLSSTGWSKLVTLRGTARSLQALWPRLPYRTAVAATFALSACEVGLAGTAALMPAEDLFAWACMGLFVAFAGYNVMVARRDPGSDQPCLCAGAAGPVETSGYARGTSNLVMAVATLVWGLGTATLVNWSQLILLGLWALPLAVWAIRRLRTGSRAVQAASLPLRMH